MQELLGRSDVTVATLATVPLLRDQIQLPIYSYYRWKRTPSEDMSIGRIFRIKEKAQLQIRADFQNAFNRWRLGAPTSTNALASQTRYASGETQTGFGDINTRAATSPRAGVIIARISF